MMLIPANVSHEDFLKDLYEDEYNDYVEDSARPGAGKPKPDPKLTPEQRKRAERARREHLSREATVRAIGSFFLAAGIVVMVTTIVIALDHPWDPRRLAAPFFAAMAVGGGLITVALGIRKRRRWARYMAGGVAGIGLFGIPLGTAAAGFILYALFSQKGRNVFSDRHVFVVDATPDLKPSMGNTVLKLGGLVALVAIQVIFFANLFG